MSDTAITVDRMENRKAWLNKLGEEFLKLEPLFPVPNFMPDDEGPKWVRNVERELAATMYPTARLKEELNFTPRRMGSLIGYSCAYGVWQMEALEALADRDESDLDTTKMTAEQMECGENYLMRIVNDWYPALRRFAKRALCSAVDQTYEDMTEFLLAYSQAFSRKPRTLDLSGIGTSATEIYLFLITYWRLVSVMQSVHQLHQCLIKVYGPYRVGQLKRVEKICQRIELHYRKPGRPKKLETIPTPA